MILHEYWIDFKQREWIDVERKSRITRLHCEMLRRQNANVDWSFKFLRLTTSSTWKPTPWKPSMNITVAEIFIDTKSSAAKEEQRQEIRSRSLPFGGLGTWTWHLRLWPPAPRMILRLRNYFISLVVEALVFSFFKSFWRCCNRGCRPVFCRL